MITRSEIITASVKKYGDRFDTYAVVECDACGLKLSGWFYMLTALSCDSVTVLCTAWSLAELYENLGG